MSLPPEPSLQVEEKLEGSRILPSATCSGSIQSKKFQEQIKRWKSIDREETPAKILAETFVQSSTTSAPATASISAPVTDSPSKLSTVAAIDSEPPPIVVLPPYYFSHFETLRCTLCAQKFPNESLLRIHDDLSESHKRNIAIFQNQSWQEMATAAAPVQPATEPIQAPPVVVPEAREKRASKKIKYKNLVEERQKLTAEIMASFDLPEPKYLVPEQEAVDPEILEDEDNVNFGRKFVDDGGVNDEEIYRQANATANMDKYCHLVNARKRHLNTQQQDERQQQTPFKSETGKKFLLKMGWKEGEGLGKEGSGLKEPILPKIAQSGRGLGS